MTTATHSLDTASGATTVAELLARNGARAGRAPHRRSRAAESGEGQFDGTLPAFAPVDETATHYRYDKTTVAALLEVEPAAEPPRAVENRPGRSGLKIAGLAFAGAVLAGGWALANAQTPDEPGGTASGPLPSNNTPESGNPLLAAAPVGAQVVTLASSAPTGTAEIPAAPAAQQPDQGRFSGTLPSTKPKAKAAAPPKASTATPPPITRPKLPPGTYKWPTNRYDFGKSWARPGGGGHHKPRR